MMASGIKVDFLVKDVIDPEEEARRIAAAAKAKRSAGRRGGGAPRRDANSSGAAGSGAGTSDSPQRPSTREGRGSIDAAAQAKKPQPHTDGRKASSANAEAKGGSNNNNHSSSSKQDSPPTGQQQQRPRTASNSDRAQAKSIGSPPEGEGSPHLTRPLTAPKRRPHVLAPPVEERPAWKSRGFVDREDLMIDQYNQISRTRRGEWGSIRAAPLPQDAFLGADASEARKTIRSSHSRERPANTSGTNVNIKPYKFPEHFYPPQIRRSEEPPPPEVADRPKWTGRTSMYDTDDRARPLSNISRSPEYFYASFRSSEALSVTQSRGSVNVTRPLDSIRNEGSIEKHSRN